MTHWKRNCVDELDKEKEAGACRCDPKNLEKNSERNFLKFSDLGNFRKPLAKKNSNEDPSNEQTNQLRPFEDIPTLLNARAFIQHDIPGIS